MLVDDFSPRTALVREALCAAGCEVVAQVASVADIAQRVQDLKPDVIIIDTDSPSRDTLEHLCLVNRDNPRPIVMFTHDGDGDKIRSAIRAGVNAYIVGGLASERIGPIMDAAIASFNEFQAMRGELEQTKTRLSERKVIEQAKGLVMERRGFTEDEAYRALRKMSMDRGLPLAEVARRLIDAGELLA